jgi:hypothetical protein
MLARLPLNTRNREKRNYGTKYLTNIFSFAQQSLTTTKRQKAKQATNSICAFRRNVQSTKSEKKEKKIYRRTCGTLSSFTRAGSPIYRLPSQRCQFSAYLRVVSFISHKRW